MALALLLDLDGTLLETLEAIVSAMNAAMADVGDLRTFTAAELRPFIGTPVQNQLRILRGIRGPPADDLANRYYAHFMALMEEEIRLLPGVRETFPRLADRRIGTMTTRRRNGARRMLELAGLLPYFASVVGGDDVDRPKPAPDLPRHGARALGVPPEMCAVVGDSPVDILAGRAAHTWTVAAMYGYGDPHDLKAANPDASLSEFADLPNVLRDLDIRERPSRERAPPRRRRAGHRESS